MKITLEALGLAHLATNPDKIPEAKLSSINARLDHLLALAFKRWPQIRHHARPTIYFDLRGTTAGQAVYGPNERIRLNIEATQDFYIETINETLPHELAHLVAHWLFNRENIAPHGHQWQDIMRYLGAKPDRTHRMPLKSANKSRRHKILCGCQKNCEVSTIVLNRIKRGTDDYSCKSCGYALREPNIL